jgi:hypothetical protein
VEMCTELYKCSAGDVAFATGVIIHGSWGYPESATNQPSGKVPPSSFRTAEFRQMYES